MIPFHKIFGRLGNQMFQGAYLYAQAKRGEIPDIYVQDPKYFDEFGDEIRQLYGEGIEPINQVAIHVRRGDYVNHWFYVDLCKTDYYEAAMEHFPTEEFLIFSDDIEFCKNHFIGKQFSFCEEKDEVKAMNLMAGCSGIIIANSSFSYWAAYISPYAKKVIAPSYEKWYTDGNTTRTVVPSEWIQL